MENDYINEEYPTSAKILDINRCALQFKTIPSMMKYLKIFGEKIENGESGCMKAIIRCKNGWSEGVFNDSHPSYTDIKLNVLLSSSRDGSIVAEIQFLLDIMVCFIFKCLFLCLFCLYCLYMFVYENSQVLRRKHINYIRWKGNLRWFITMDY